MTMGIIGTIGAVVGVGGLIEGAIGIGDERKNAAFAKGLAGDQQYKQDVSFQQLQDLMKNPGDFFNSPVYKAAADQGTQAVQRGEAAGGYLGSGKEAAALQKYGQSFGQQQLFQQESLLAGMSGTQFNPAGAINASTSANSVAFDQLGTLLYSLGQMGGGGGGFNWGGLFSGTPGGGGGGGGVGVGGPGGLS